jgi:hypothetical protein
MAWWCRFWACYRRPQDFKWTTRKFRSYLAADMFFADFNIAGLFCWIVPAPLGVPPTWYLKNNIYPDYDMFTRL